jgi:hypothetical protein
MGIEDSSRLDVRSFNNMLTSYQHMKTILLIMVIALPVFSTAQEIPPDLLKKMENTKPDSAFDRLNQTLWIPVVSKGRITFLDGRSYRFNNISVSGDSVSWSRSKNRMIRKPVSEIKEITEPDPKILNGLAIGAGIGLFTGLITGALAYPENSFLETLVQIFNAENDFPRISKKAIPVVVGFTVAGSAIGTLVGLDNKRTVYRIGDAVQVHTELFPVQGQHQGFLMTLSLTF